MTIKELREKNLIVLECISGSKAYGLDTPSSDTDLKGVFVLPKKEYYGLDYIEQVNNESNDEVFYELGRFLELLSVNNPNILELLNSPKESIVFKHPFMEEILPEKLLSKLCCNTFGRFALAQIKKAKGLNKKIVNPMEAERKTLLSFCFVNYEQGSIPLEQYLGLKNWKQEYCGLINIAHMHDVYGLYYNEKAGYQGVFKGEDSNDVCLSSIEKGAEQVALMYFNRSGYSFYCKEFKEYWDWVGKRNEERYRNTQSNGRNYDAKNMMHVFRLLEMAIEIGRDKKLNVHRPNRDFLLSIKAGAFEYEELLALALEKKEEMELAFANSDLMESPDMQYINDLAYRLRERFYAEKEWK